MTGRPGHNVVDINIGLLRESRVERRADQAALPERVDRESRKRLREQRAVLHDAQGTSLLADEYTAVASNSHCRRAGQTRGDASLDESRRQRRFSRRRKLHLGPHVTRWQKQCDACEEELLSHILRWNLPRWKSGPARLAIRETGRSLPGFLTVNHPRLASSRCRTRHPARRRRSCAGRL